MIISLSDILHLFSTIKETIKSIRDKRKSNIQIKLLNCKMRVGNELLIENIGHCDAQNVSVTINNDDCYWDCSTIDKGKKLAIGTFPVGAKHKFIVVNTMVGCGLDVSFSIIWSDKHTKSNQRQVTLHLYSIDCCL